MIVFVLCVVIILVVMIYASMFLEGLNIILDLFMKSFPLILSLGTLIYAVINC